MRRNVELFTLQMSLSRTEELFRNSVAKLNGDCCIPRFTENGSGIEKFVFKQSASRYSFNSISVLAQEEDLEIVILRSSQPTRASH